MPLLLFVVLLAIQPSAGLRIVVTAAGDPVAGAQVVVAGITTTTSAEGVAILQVTEGPVETTVVKAGFNPVTITTTANINRQETITVELEPQVGVEEHVTVSATRSANASKIRRCGWRCWGPTRSKRNS